ncbi:MAG TPA: hypothetical protein VGO53_15275 [Steroidobacteraceae bacterium]|jgi:hypothetical protein|nr:hypothetical protein [Steroidobacteraceae bacterium]
MEIPVTQSSTPPRRLGRSILAILIGLVAVIALSLATDQLFHVLQVYPPWNQPMHETSLLLLALSYRLVYGVVGSYLAARFAPRAHMLHAMVLGGIGFVLSLLGAITMKDAGPIWYPIALVLTALPCAWIGGLLYRTPKTPG